MKVLICFFHHFWFFMPVRKNCVLWDRSREARLALTTCSGKLSGFYLFIFLKKEKKNENKISLFGACYLFNIEIITVQFLTHEVGHLVHSLHIFNRWWFIIWMSSSASCFLLHKISLTFSGVPVKQEKPGAFPDTRTSIPPRRTYIPEIHIPLRIPHRTVPVTSRPHAKPSDPRQPYVPPQPSRPHQQPHQPVVLTGVAGPPGYAQRVPSRHERGSHESPNPINGFAGAPASGQRQHSVLICVN